MIRAALVVAQAATFFGLGALLLFTDWRLGIAQVLLGIITILIYL